MTTRRQLFLEGNRIVGPIVADARRRVERIADHERKLAELERAIPDDTTERIPLSG